MTLSMQLTNVIESLDEPLRCVLTRPLIFLLDKLEMFRSSHPEVFLGKGVLIICGKFTGEHPCWSAIWIKLQITFRHGCSPVNLLHIFRTPFVKNTSRRFFWMFQILIISRIKQRSFLWSYWFFFQLNYLHVSYQNSLFAKSAKFIVKEFQNSLVV